MEFNARVNDGGMLGRIGGRVTGSYLRDASSDALRIIQAHPERSTDELTAEVMQMFDARGRHDVDPAEVRKLVAEVKDQL
jgi:hypothetical protein